MRQQRIDRAVAQQAVLAQGLAIGDLVRGIGQPQAEPFAQPVARWIDEETLQCVAIRNRLCFI